MMNRDEEYNRLHDHCQALGRERDGLQLQVDDLQKRIQLAVAETYSGISKANFAFNWNVHYFRK